MLGYSGDLTSPGNTELTSVCYEYSYPDSNSNTSKQGVYNNKSASEHHYEQPMVGSTARLGPVLHWDHCFLISLTDTGYKD